MHRVNKLREEKVLQSIQLDWDTKRDIENEVNRALNQTSTILSDRVLDIPCGNGSITNRLAKLGYKVTGVDNSHACIAQAIAHIPQELQNPPAYFLADMRHFRDCNRFDVVLVLWGSFGLGDEADDLLLLKNMNSQLSAKGRVLINTHNTDTLRNRYPEIVEGKEHTAVIGSQDTSVTLIRTFEPCASRLVTNYIVEMHGSFIEFQRSFRIYSTEEMNETAKQSGFILDKIFSGRSDQDYDSDSLYASYILEPIG